MTTSRRYFGGGLGSHAERAAECRLNKPRGFLSPESSVSSTWRTPPPPPPMPPIPMMNRLRRLCLVERPARAAVAWVSSSVRDASDR